MYRIFRPYLQLIFFNYKLQTISYKREWIKRLKHYDIWNIIQKNHKQNFKKINNHKMKIKYEFKLH